MKTMNDLFLHFLRDIYYAEKAFAKSSSKIMKAVQNDDVREFLKKAKDQAQEPIDALDRVFETVDKRPRGKTCEAMTGLLAECQEAIEEGESGPVLDAALIACLQGIKCPFDNVSYPQHVAASHAGQPLWAVLKRYSQTGTKTYEITRYGSLLAFARQMGLDAAIEDLVTLRDAARRDDEALSKVAEGDINVAASKETGGDDESKQPDDDEEPGEPDEKGKPKTVKKPAAKR